MIDNIYQLVMNVVILLLVAGLVLVLMGVLFFALTLWIKWRDREKKSLELVTLCIAVPEENEVKIDAMEQILNSFSSLYKSAKFKWLQRFQAQPSLTFEIVGTSEDIRFYISTPKKYQDLVEKQVYSIFAGADIMEVDEPNIYPAEGKAEYCWLGMKKTPFYPLKTYKEIPTDPLASITSAFSKLSKDESVAIQLVISPTDGSWARSGKGFVATTKKSEANPEKASYKVDARQLEAIDAKASKPGFETAIRIVSFAPSTEVAKTNLANVKACFGQYESPWNKLSTRKLWLKGLFLEDFIYKYPIIFWWKGITILSSDEIASIFHFPNLTI